MDLGDAGDGGQRTMDSLRVDPTRYRIERKIEAFAEEIPRAKHNHQCDHDAHQGIDRIPACQKDRDPGDGHAGRHGRVGRHVQKCTPDIGIVLTPDEEKCGERIDHDAHDCHAYHQGPFHVRRRLESMDGFPENHAAGCEQEHRIAKSGIDRGASEAKGVAKSRRASCQVAGGPSQEQADDVAGIVTGIRDQGQRVGEETAGEFRNHEDYVQGHADGHGSVDLFERHTVAVMVPMIRVIVR